MKSSDVRTAGEPELLWPSATTVKGAGRRMKQVAGYRDRWPMERLADRLRNATSFLSREVTVTASRRPAYLAGSQLNSGRLWLEYCVLGLRSVDVYGGTDSLLTDSRLGYIE